MISTAQVIEKLRTVYDPEIPVNIYDLGLVYGIDVIVNDIYIIMTLTTATCPAAAFLPEEVKAALQAIPHAGKVQVEVVYEPKWTKDRMSPEAQMQLGF